MTAMRTEQTIPSDFDSLSGIWRCRWVQYGRTALEELALQIQNGCVHGDGVDPDGMFAYTGFVHTDGTVSLAKVYIIPNIPVPPSLTYIGHWNGKLVTGEWIDDQDPNGNHGPFLMWPGQGDAPGLQAEASETPERALPNEVMVVRAIYPGARTGRRS